MYANLFHLKFLAKTLFSTKLDPNKTTVPMETMIDAINYPKFPDVYKKKG